MTKDLMAIIRYENEHIIVDCCPRKGDMTPPSLDASVVRAYNLEPDFNFNRPKYTLCLNVMIVDGIVQDKGRMDVCCPHCKSVYVINEQTLDATLEAAEHKQSI